MLTDLDIIPLTEGVETKQQFESLVQKGCQLFQGYYFSKPIAINEFESCYSIGSTQKISNCT